MNILRALGATRSSLYQSARLLGDVNAVARGTILQRLVRSFLLRLIGGAISKLIR